MGNNVRKGKPARDSRKAIADENREKRAKITDRQHRDALIAMGHGHCKEVARLTRKLEKEDALQPDQCTDH